MLKFHIIKYLSFGLKKKSGINYTGKKMFKTRGAGCSKRKFRLIDFYRLKYQVPALVLKIEYDPNRTSFIALICYKNGILSYILAADGLAQGDFLNNSVQKVGIANKIKVFSLGTFVSMLELRPKFGAKISRAAGTYCVILKRDHKLTLVRLPSGIQRFFGNKNICTLGIVSNINHKFEKKKKAGNNF
jgi:large subunit ribosomal protein L2